MKYVITYQCDMLDDDDSFPIIVTYDDENSIVKSKWKLLTDCMNNDLRRSNLCIFKKFINKCKQLGFNKEGYTITQKQILDELSYESNILSEWFIEAESVDIK